MATNTVLNIIVNAEDNASPELGGVGESLAKIGKAAGAGLAALGAAVAAFSVKAVQAGSAAQEMQSKFATVFGASSSRATEQLKAFGEEVGRSRLELQAMAASVQDTFVPMGFARGQAAELSVSLTKLATDVASFTNAADADVMAAFQSALVGNHEAVRSFGIVITEVALNAELLRMGIEKGTQAATEQEKVQARLNLLYAGTRDAQGDAARTADSWANQMRRLQGVVADMTAEVGLRLLPVLTPLLEKFTAFVSQVTPTVIQAATDIVTWLSNLGREFELTAVRIEVSSDRIRAKAAQLGADTARIGNEQVTFWAGVGMTIDQWITNMLARISHFAEALSRGFATIGQAWEFVKVGNIQAALDLIAYSFDLDSEAIQRTNEKIISFNEILGYAAQKGVSYSEALLALRMKAEAASGALLIISDKARGNAEALETAQESVLSFQDVLASFSEGVVEMADVWKSAWDAVQEATSDGMGDNQRRIMEGFGAVREQYVDHAVTIAGLQNDMNNALLELDNEYQGLSKKLQEAGETAKLADLNAAYKAKQAGIVAAYGAQIQTEQAGQTALLQGAKRYYVTTLSIMMQQLRAQVATVAANMQALVRMTASGYASMAAAVAAYNAIKVGITNIADIQAAMAEVQSAMAGIAAAGEAAVAGAAADFANWNAATQDLSSSLGDVDTSLGDISRPGGSGSNIRPQVVDPLEAAAKAATQMANAVEKAIATFNALAKWGGPGTGWETKFSLLITSIIAMVKRFAEAVVTIKNAGLLEEGPRNELLAFADMVGRVAKAFDAALGSADKLAAFRPEVIGAQTVAVVEAMRLLVTSLAKLMAEMQTAMRPSASTAFDFDALAEFAAQVEAIMKPWKAAVDAIAAVASYGAARIGPAANMLLQQVYGLAFKLSQVNERLTGEAWTAAAEGAGRVEQIVKPWRSMVDAIKSLAEYTFGRIGPAANTLLDQVYGLAFKLGRANALLSEDAWAAATQAAGRVEQVVRPWRAMVDAVKGLAEYTYSQIGPAANTLLDQIYGLAYKLSQFNDNLAPQMWNAAAQAADRITEVTGFVKDAIDAIAALAAYVAAQGLAEAVGAFLDDIVTVAREIALRLGDAAALVISDEAVTLSEGIGRLVAFIRGSIDALNALAEYGQARRGNFAARITQLMTDLQATAQGIVFGLRGFSREVLASLEEMAPITEALGRVVAFIQGVAEALNAVAGYGQEQRVNFGQRIDALMADLQAVARGIVFGLRGFSREVLASLDETAIITDALGRLVAFIQGTTEALNALAIYGQTGKVNFTARIGALMSDLMATATGILAGLTTLSHDVMDGLDEAAATTDALGRLVAFVQGSIDALRALATYEAVADIGPRVRAFATDIVTVGHALRVGLGELSAPLKAAFDAAIEFAERISGIVGVIRPGMDAIASVVTYKRGSVDLRAATMRFVEDLLVVAEALRDGLGAPSQAILDAYDAAREFADRIAGMINFVKPALDVLRELNRYGGPGNLHAGVLTFLMHIEGLINALATTFQRMGPDLVRQAAEFSELIRAIVSNIVGAMRELAGLGDVAALVTAAFGVGQGWMDGLIDGLSSRVGDLVALMAYIRGLFPSSPAEHGPWRSLPQGALVSQEWLGGMTRALGQTSGLESTLGGLRDLFVGAPMAQAALAGAGGYGRAGQPATTTTNVTFTMQGPFYIREEADIRRLAEQVGNVLAGQADMRWRMGA